MKEFQVSITGVAAPANAIPQLQGQSASEPGTATPLASDEELVPEPGGVVLVNEEPYYKIKELDVVPRPISTITPRYPETVPASIRRGVARLEIKLDEDGVVTEVTVLGSQPPGYFEDAAREAFLNAKFTPGIKSGRKVRSLLTLQVHFEPNRLFNGGAG